MLAHDAQCAAAGVTTVLDALCLGDLGFDAGRGQTFLDGVRDLDALGGTGLLKAEHFLHLRCELPAHDMPQALGPGGRPSAGADGQPDGPLARRRPVPRHRPLPRHAAAPDAALGGRGASRGSSELLDQRARLREPQRRWLLRRLAHRALPLASHDDDSAEDVAQNAEDGIRISEFPVVMEAAVEARRIGVAVIAGAPNIVRGGSHSGNVAAIDMIRAGTVDALASDYVPAALVEAAWRSVRRGRDHSAQRRSPC